MPGLDGIEATRRIVDAAPHVAVLVLTMHDDDETVFAAVRAGARGYLLKGAQRAELIRAVRAVAAGDAIFGPGVARRLMDLLRPAGAAPGPRAPFPELTEREREILDLVARGRSNAEITAQLVPVAQDRAQPRVEHLREAPGPRPRRGDRAGTRGGAGRRGGAAADPAHRRRRRRASRDTDRDTGPMTTGHDAPDPRHAPEPTGHRPEDHTRDPILRPTRPPHRHRRVRRVRARPGLPRRARRVRRPALVRHPPGLRLPARLVHAGDARARARWAASGG